MLGFNFNEMLTKTNALVTIFFWLIVAAGNPAPTLGSEVGGIRGSGDRRGNSTDWRAENDRPPEKTRGVGEAALQTESPGGCTGRRYESERPVTPTRRCATGLQSEHEA